MKISVIICSRNRGPRLAATLARLPAQELRRHHAEVLVVDSASQDDTWTRIERFVGQARFPAFGVHVTKAGASRARNAGAHRAKGDLLVFTDDDCAFDAGYFAHLTAEFDPAIHDFGGGAIVPVGTGPESRVASTKWWRIRKPTLVPPNSLVPTGGINGRNMFIKREVFDKIAGFRNDIGAGTEFHFEDCELGTRASLS